jgi:hypothetical protein
LYPLLVPEHAYLHFFFWRFLLNDFSCYSSSHYHERTSAD